MGHVVSTIGGNNSRPFFVLPAASVPARNCTPHFGGQSSAQGSGIKINNDPSPQRGYATAQLWRGYICTYHIISRGQGIKSCDVPTWDQGVSMVGLCFPKKATIATAWRMHGPCLQESGRCQSQGGKGRGRGCWTPRRPTRLGHCRMEGNRWKEYSR